MAEFKEILEALAKEVADLKKNMADKPVVSKEDIDKRANEIVQKQMDLQKAQLIAAQRKGSFSERAEDAKPQDLIVEKAADAKTLELQKFNDNAYMLSKLLKVHPHQTKYWQKYAPAHTEMRKAMDSATAGEGLEWIPTEFSADLIDRVRLARKVANLFPEINMPSNPYKLPVNASDATGYLVAENTADDPSTKSFRPSTPGSSNVTLTASKLGARVQFSEELSEDSIIPILEYTKNSLAQSIVDALENALINGDTTATHMDADVTQSYDARKAFKGLRKHAPDASQVSLSTFTSVSTIRSMRSAMGKFGVDPSKLVILASAKGFIKMLGLAEVITVDKYGPAATVLSGELAKVDGISIVVSEFVRDDLNTVGVNDATTNSKGELIMVYVPAFLIGNRRKVTLKSFEDVQNDQTSLVISWRGDFQPVQSASANVLAVEGVNLTL